MTNQNPKERGGAERRLSLLGFISPSERLATAIKKNEVIRIRITPFVFYCCRTKITYLLRQRFSQSCHYLTPLVRQYSTNLP